MRAVLEEVKVEDVRDLGPGDDDPDAEARPLPRHCPRHEGDADRDPRLPGRLGGSGLDRPFGRVGGDAGSRRAPRMGARVGVSTS